MNHAAACALWLALAGLCPALEPPRKPLPAAPAVRMAPAPAAPGLTVEGQYVLTVTALPFTVTAPQDADLFFWSVPPGWKASGGERSVQVTAAPEGTGTVTLQTVTVDWRSQKVIKGNYSLTIAVGNVTPPPGPGPTPPPPSDPLVKDLQAAYDADTSPDKARHKASLAALYHEAPATATAPAIDTVGKLFATLAAASASLLPADALKGVRTRLQAALKAELPTKADTPLDTATRDKAAALFRKFALALEAVR